MANFIVYVEQVEYEEYEVVVEVKSIKSVEEEWEGISDVVDEYCYNDSTEDLDDDGTIFKTKIKLVLGTQESKKLWVDDYEVVSVVKVDEAEYDHE